MDELTQICKTTVEKLLKKKLTLASAESITGGMFAKCVTDIPGTSAIFKGSLVTYSFEAKNKELGIDLDFLNSEGAVNERTAREMVQGVYDKFKPDFCVSVTGVAGPGPDSNGIPAGTFYVGFCAHGTVSVHKFEEGDLGRNGVRIMACRRMFELIGNSLID